MEVLPPCKQCLQRSSRKQSPFCIVCANRKERVKMLEKQRKKREENRENTRKICLRCEKDFYSPMPRQKFCQTPCTYEIYWKEKQVKKTIKKPINRHFCVSYPIH